MPDQIEPYDPNAIMRKVTDRIKASFAELVPDEKWAEMVEAQIDKFTKPFSDSYGRQSASEFDNLCQSLLKEVAQDKIREYVKDKYAQRFDNGKAIDAALKTLLAESAEVMFANIMRAQFQNMINQMMPR